MQKQITPIFNSIEFKDAIEGSTDIFVGHVWSMEEIHELIISTMTDVSLVNGEAIPMEWRTGFIFGAISEIIMEIVLKQYGGQIQTYLNRH